MLGTRYQNNIFGGDITSGQLYIFEVNSTRIGLAFNEPPLKDLIAEGEEELESITWNWFWRYNRYWDWTRWSNIYIYIYILTFDRVRR